MHNIALPSSTPIVTPAEAEGDTGERILHLIGTVNPETSIKVVNLLLQFNAENPTLPVHMQVFSPGGCVISGLAIIDTMRHIECPVFTYCIGYAASMGALILACGEKDHRYILPRSEVMIHQPSGQLGGTLDNVRATMDFHNRLEQQVTGLLAEATGKNAAAIRKATRTDNWLSARASQAFGIVDHILEPHLSTPTKINQKKIL